MQHWQPIELFYLLALSVLLGLIYFLAIALPIASLVKSKTKGDKKSVKCTTFCFSIVIVAMACSACLAYGAFIEPKNLQTSFVKLTTRKLLKTSIRIVQISDIHSDAKAVLEEEIPKKIAELNPDVIAITGDACNSSDGLPVFKAMVKELVRVAPTYLAKGDWDFSFKPPLDYIGETEAKLLFNRPFEIKKDGESIWIGGTSTGSFGLVKEVLDNMPEDKFKVFAYHEPYPDILPQSPFVDLFLTGHTHGGQVVLPLVGALITRSKFGTQYVSGSYQIGNGTLMYVNRGIGEEGHFPRVRFNCPPEISVIDLVPENH